MRYLLFILALSAFSCKKQNAIKELEGTYDVEGHKVRCTYYGCDSTKIKSLLKLQFENENTRIRVTLFDKILEKSDNIGVLALDKIDNDLIIMKLNEFYANYNRSEKIFEYYDGNNWNKRILTDTASNYYYLKGVKQ